MNKAFRTSLTIAGIYALLGSAWIYFSDRAVFLLAQDSGHLTRIGTIKGWMFIAVTTIVLQINIWLHLRKLLAAQQALRSQKIDLEATLKCFPDVLLTFNSEGIISDCKAGTAVELFPCTKTVIGKSIHEVLPHDVACRFVEETANGFNNAGTVDFCSDVLSSGEVRHHEARILPDGSNRFIAIIRDISRLKRAEEEQRKAVARIAEEQARSESIIASIGDGITIHDTDCRIVYENQTLQKLLGNNVGECCKASCDVRGESCAECPLSKTLADGMIRRAEKQVSVNGRSLYLDNTYSPIRNAEGEIVAVLEMIRDITEHRNSDEKLRTTQEFLANLMELVPLPIYVTAFDGHFQMVNRAWEQFTGISREDAVGRHAEHFFGESMAKQFIGTDQQVIEDACPMVIEQFVETANGRNYFHTVRFPLHDAQGEVEAVGGILVDITERKRFEEQLVYQATHDFLTGLPNRNLLHDRLEEALSYEFHHNGMLALLLLDLDNFKIINDSFGHAAGDLLLKEVAEKLKHNLRQYDTFARLGGDEFVILLRDTEHDLDIGRVATRILSVLTNNPICLKEQEVFVTVSIGIAIFPADGQDAEMLLKNADAAMFHAKKKGKNNYQFFTEEINADVHDRLAMETKLRRALDREEFFLHYQPRIDMATGRVSGMEALLRWQPEGGRVVSPGEFIPLLEETGLIVPVEEWVLRTACEQTKVWQKEGLSALRLAVNISARHFSQENLPDKISQILSDTGLDARFLEIELTESIIMKDVEESIKKLDNLKEMGITFSIDDFGTGYSSLSYLKRFPIDVLKIDRSFVDGIPHDSSDTTISKTVIAMAHNLKMSVVAEGVETGEQLAFLSENKCDEYQGFYFSKPLSAKDFAALMQKDPGPPGLAA